MKKYILILLAVISCKSGSYTDYVDPYIGSGGHGHVFVGANVPHSMVQLGPHQPTRGWDWCSGYAYRDTVVLGFSHTRLSGTGIGELGDVLVMPLDLSKPLKYEDGHVYATLDHALETVKPGAYALEMPDYGVKAELSSGLRVGYHRYTFSEGATPAILIALETGTGWDKMTSCSFEKVDETHYVGHRSSTGWTDEHTFYFAIELSQPAASQADSETSPVTILSFQDIQTLDLKVALSPVSKENALANLSEIPHWSYEKVASAAQKAWNEELGRIEIDPIDEKVGRIFYTALYHFAYAPYLFSDPNGQYRGADGLNHQAAHPTYTIFSLWDTYRAAMPLLSIVDPTLAKDVAQTFLNIYHEQGRLPVWHLCGDDTDCMPGNAGVVVLGDYVLKGLVPESQWEEALEAMVATQMRDERDLDLLKKYGYIPYDLSPELETVSKGLEYAVADAAVYRVAELCDDGMTYNYFLQRSKAFTKYFDFSVNFVRGRASDGTFREPFDPFKALHMKSDFTEGNAWQYTFMVPHDVPSLVELFGSKEKFAAKLDSLFVAEGDMGDDHDDVTGLLGQYAHGNEPSHHVAYMYNYIGQQHKCAELVRRLLKDYYDDQPDGLSGNEDVGQMSAWYILSAIGLYQVDPIGGDYLIGSPCVHSAKIHLEGGKTFEIIAHNNSEQNIYVQSASLNGKPLPELAISYEQIMRGGRLELQMGPAPSGNVEIQKP